MADTPACDERPEERDEAGGMLTRLGLDQVQVQAFFASPILGLSAKVGDGRPERIGSAAEPDCLVAK
jgi:hypothetical protein